MGKYGRAAIQATRLVKSGRVSNPRNAWNQATSTIFGKGTSSQTKSCPRDAYLGCCQAGLVKGVRPGNYTNSQDSAAYSIEAAQWLKAHGGHVKIQQGALWRHVLKTLHRTTKKAHNGQMDVVVALYNNGLIK